MKCPKCGSEILEGHLYCESCGMEIQIVPDFEPEIENSITKTLSTVAEEIEEETPSAPEMEPAKEQPKPGKKEEFLSETISKNSLFMIVLGFLAVMTGIILVSVAMYHRYSLPYQLKQAEKYATREDYERAVGYLQQAAANGGDAVEIAMQESFYYELLGEDQKAIDVLLTLLDRKHLEYEEKEKVYQRILTLYQERGSYEEMNRLIQESEDTQILARFQQYTATAPEFSYESGSYDEMLSLRLSAVTAGKIYYTLDGSDPDEHSIAYTAPLPLESGEYQIAAVFVNEYGVKSEIAKRWYLINLQQPKEPEVLLASGEYHTPVSIEVAAVEDEAVYYTTDGSIPTRESQIYTEPIPLPLGRTNFNFAVISEEGLSSDIVSRSYYFNLLTEVTVDKAIRNVKQALIDKNILTDLDGHSVEIEGKYVFSYQTIVEIPDMGYYYVLNEAVEYAGARKATERLYAVEVYSGKANRLIYDERGQMGLIPLD